MHDEANDWTSAGQLRARLTADALLHDHGFAYANRVDGRVIEFIRLDPCAVTPKQDATTGEPFFSHRVGNRETIYSYRDVLHISAPLSIAPIKAGREAIGLAAILEKHAARLFAGGARPSSILWNEGKAGSGSDGGATVVANIRKGWRAMVAANGNDPLILDGGWQHKQVALSSTDAQFAEMRVEQTVEIARLFRIPPHLLFELSRATWSNAEEMFQSFLTLTLRTWLDEWEWAYARVLLSSDERATGYHVEFVIDDLLTANAATRATTYAQYRAMGALTANEVRDGLNRQPHLDGDTLQNPYTTSGAQPAEAAAA